MASTERASIVLLSEDSDGQALVSMGDGDKFTLAVADAARACRAFDAGKDFVRQFRDLVNTLASWVEPRRGKMRCAHLIPRENDVLFLVIHKGSSFDQELSDELTDLDLEVANSKDLNMVDLEVLAIPSVSDESCRAFLASGKAFKTYA